MPRKPVLTFRLPEQVFNTLVRERQLRHLNVSGWGPRRRPSRPSNATSPTPPATPVNLPNAPLQLKIRREPPPRKRLLRFAAGGPVNCPMAASARATMTPPPCPTSSSVSRSRSRPTPGSGSCAGSTPSATAPPTRSSCATGAENPEIRLSWPGGRDGHFDRPDDSRDDPRLQAPAAVWPCCRSRGGVFPAL